MYNAERNLISNREKKVTLSRPRMWLPSFKKEGSQPSPKHPNQVIARFWAGTPGIPDCLF